MSKKFFSGAISAAVIAIVSCNSVFAQAAVPMPPSSLAIDGVGGSTPAAGIPKPGSNNTVVWDTRAGGSQSFQLLSSLTQILSVYGAYRNSNGATQFFESNVDGLGTNARGCQLASPNGSEQECYFATEGTSVRAPATGWYTQFKVHLGKSATGGGKGTVNSWTLTGGNPHQKMFIWTRASGTERVYLDVMPGQTNLRIDGLNYNSPVWSINPYDRTGVQTITVYIRPDNGTVRAWVEDKLVMDATGQKIGSSSLVDIQESVTTFPGQEQVQYMWDTVVWY